MKMIKIGADKPLVWNTSKIMRGKDLHITNHYERNNLILDVFEIHKPDGKVYKAKLISDVFNNPLLGKAQEIINGIKTKEKYV